MLCAPPPPPSGDLYHQLALFFAAAAAATVGFDRMNPRRPRSSPRLSVCSACGNGGRRASDRDRKSHVGVMPRERKFSASEAESPLDNIQGFLDLHGCVDCFPQHRILVLTNWRFRQRKIQPFVELRLPSHHAFSTKNVQGLAKTRASGCEVARPARQKCGE